MEWQEDYSVGKYNLFHIRNKNELRVVKLMPRVLSEYAGFEPTQLDIEDIYALTLNKLPSRYVQKGTIVLREPVSESYILDALREAVGTVKKRPNY